MRPKTDKKIFFVNGQEYTLVKGRRWYIEYEDSGRKRKYDPLNRIKDLDAREEKAKELIQELAARSEATTSVLLTMLDRIRPSHRGKTNSNRQSHIKAFIGWLGKRPDALVTPEIAFDYIHHLAAVGLAPETIRSHRRSLVRIYNLIDKKSNPFKDSPVPKGESKSLQPFDDQQIFALKSDISVADPRLWLAVQLLCYCFIRPEEMRFLTTGDFNLNEGYIEVRAEISKNKRTQKVVIPDCFLPDLRSYPLFQDRRNQLLFVTKWGRYNGPVGKNYFNRMHRQYLDALGICGRYAFYSWKHTGAIMMVKAGINMKDLQLQLRHHSLDQVNTYLRDLGVLDSNDLRKKVPGILAVQKRPNGPCSAVIVMDFRPAKIAV